MWLAEKVTTLEKENEELKGALREMETRLATQENMARQADERCARLEAAITQIVDFVQQQNATIENSRVLMNSLVEDVRIHHDNFEKLGLILHVHEQRIVQSGAVTQEMAQYMNALIQENQQKSLKIASPMREYQAQTEVLRQNQMGQQVIAEVVKRIIAGQQQQPQQQGFARTGPTVSEEDDHNGTEPNFPNAPSPHAGPPNIGPFGAVNQIVQVPASIEILQGF